MTWEKKVKDVYILLVLLFMQTVFSLLSYHLDPMLGLQSSFALTVCEIMMSISDINVYSTQVLTKHSKVTKKKTSFKFIKTSKRISYNEHRLQIAS